MNNFVQAFVVATLFFGTQAFGIVLDAPNLDMLESYIKKLDEDALVVFDVDFTLLVPNDQLLSPSGEEHYAEVSSKNRRSSNGR